MLFINENLKTKLTVKEDDQGGLLFDLYEVANNLGYAKPKRAIQDFYLKHFESETVDPRVPGQLLVEEWVLYLFLMESNAARAKEFKIWVCKEVLPAIRKVGLLAVKELALLHAIRKGEVKNKEDALKIAPQECFDSILASSDTFYRLEGFVAPSEIADTLGIRLKEFYSRLVSCDILDSRGELLKPGLAKHCSKYHNSYTECGKWYAWSLDVVGLLSTSPKVKEPRNRTIVSGGGQVELELTV